MIEKPPFTPEDDLPPRAQRVMDTMVTPVSTEGKNWPSAIPRGIRKVMEYLLILIIFGCVGYQLRQLHLGVTYAAYASKPTIEYLGDLVPDKKFYRAGDPIRFHYVRHTEFFPGNPAPLVCLSLDSYENKSNGEIYPGVVIGRLIDAPGTVRRSAVRRLPADMNPGTYVFEGWIQAQTPRRTLPAPYKSEPFEIVP